MQSREPGLVLELRFPSHARELKQVRAAVRDAVLRGGGSEACADDVVMAVDEACQNVIRHAYGGDPTGTILLRMERAGDELVVNLIDYAPEIDPSCVQGRELGDVKPGGLGTHLIRETMDEVDFVEPPPGCGNLLRMVKRLRQSG